VQAQQGDQAEALASYRKALKNSGKLAPSDDWMVDKLLSMVAQ
jgi:hypothetical protein